MSKVARMTAKGLLTFALPSAVLNRSAGGTMSARYCYSVYLRHLAMIDRVAGDCEPATVAELGPGASIGIGLAALIAGADRYYGFDIKSYVLGERNLEVFDELIRLFSDRAAIPDEGEFPSVRPFLDDYRFPSRILTDTRLSRALAPDRIARLRAVLVGGPEADETISYRAPWYDPSILRKETVNWIFSQAVMEHVDDVKHTYQACFDWLKPGGMMSHRIDFRCHGTADAWNGHLAYSELTWRMIRGGRSYLLNRLPHSAHCRLMGEAGFDIDLDERESQDAGIGRSQLARRFADIPDDDLKISGAFIIGRKPAH